MLLFLFVMNVTRYGVVYFVKNFVWCDGLCVMKGTLRSSSSWSVRAAGLVALVCSVIMFGLSGGALAFSEGHTTSARLHFQGGSTFKVVSPNSLLQAAVIPVFRGQVQSPTWQVARVEPGSQLDRRTLTFSTLPQVTDNNLRVSPALPTKVPGLYLVKPNGPGLGALAPIHYQVSGQMESQLAAPQTISLVAPRAGQKVMHDFKFQWAVKDPAPFYRYELYVSQFVPFFGSQEQAGESDLSTVYQYGQLVPGHVRALSAASVPTPALSSQSTTYWRVVGLDAGGNTVSVSPLQRVDIQP